MSDANAARVPASTGAAAAPRLPETQRKLAAPRVGRQT
jgi:hypothetical protein